MASALDWCLSYSDADLPLIRLSEVYLYRGYRHEQAQAPISALADADRVLMLQALGEFSRAVTRKAKMPADAAAVLMHNGMERFPVAAADGRLLVPTIQRGS